MAEQEQLAQGTLPDGWLAVLDRYRVQFLVLDKERDGRLLSSVRSQPSWTVDFENRTSVLLSRSTAGGF